MITLKSDFTDYYDYWFEPNQNLIFERYTNSGMSRLGMFNFLEDNNICVPEYGLVKHCINDDNKNRDCVVYLNDYSHQGKDKIKLSYLDAYKQYHNRLCSKFINSRFYLNQVESYRYLQIGSKYFNLKYTASSSNPKEDVWKSNDAENIDIEILNNISIINLNKKFPLFAIDFVKGYDGDFYAIDFNIAPQIKGTGIEKILKGKEVYTLISDVIKLI